MPRRVQDIVPGDRRRISDVSEKAPAEKKPVEREIPVRRKEAISSRKMPITPPAEEFALRPKRKRAVWLLITLGIIVIVAGIGFIASQYYSRASFVIVPKVLPITVNGTYVAQPSPAANGFAYELITLKSSASTTVASVPGPQISTKSQGKVVFVNSFGVDPVRLIAGTRLSDSRGYIYRLNSSIVVPGFKQSGSAAPTPGSIAASVIADQPGEDYNIARNDLVTDLKIVAYKGSPKYNTVYAKMSSDFTGGFLGMKRNLSAATLASTTAILKANITSSLLSQLKSAIPDGYILFDNSYVVSFPTAATVGGTDKNKATVSLAGTIYAFPFKQSILISKLSSGQSDSTFGSYGYETVGLDTLKLSITNLKDFSASKKTTLVLNAKGDLKLIAKIPVEEIKSKLRGISLSATQDIFKSYGQIIESGSGELAPPWAKIPNDLSRITVTVKNP